MSPRIDAADTGVDHRPLKMGLFSDDLAQPARTRG